jgi:hypothetical protein
MFLPLPPSPMVIPSIAVGVRAWRAFPTPAPSPNCPQLPSTSITECRHTLLLSGHEGMMHAASYSHYRPT